MANKKSLKSDRNVFISWSGARSLHTAGALYEMLPLVIDAVRPWMSDENLRTGKAWFPEIMKQLDAIKIGIVCLTPENLGAPWLNFEAGALAGKLLDDTLVVPYRTGGVRTRDVKPPLSQYQGGDAEDPKFTLKLVREINAATGGTVADGTLAKKFEKFWPDLEAKVKAMPPADESPPPETSLDVVADEILDLLRSIRADVPPRPAHTNPFYGDNGGFYPSSDDPAPDGTAPTMADLLNRWAELSRGQGITIPQASSAPSIDEIYRRAVETANAAAKKKPAK